MVGPLSSKFGRKHGLWAAALLNAIATAIQLGTTSKAALYVARLILGNSTLSKLLLISNGTPRRRCRMVLNLLTTLHPRSSTSPPPRRGLWLLSNNALNWDRSRCLR